MDILQPKHGTIIIPKKFYIDTIKLSQISLCLNFPIASIMSFIDVFIVTFEITNLVGHLEIKLGT